MPTRNADSPGRRVRRTREDIVAAAATVFAQKGYATATVDDIAMHLGILKGSVYYHVRSKEELLYAVVEEPLAEMVAQLEQIATAEVPADVRLERFVRMHLEALMEYAPNMFVYLQDLFGAERSEKIRELNRRYEGLVEQLIGDGIKDGSLRPGLDLRYCTLALLGSLNWTHTWFRADKERTQRKLSKIVNAFITVNLDGLRARE